MFGLIKKIHVRNDILRDNGTVDPAKLKPIGRLGDISYARLGDMFKIPRPSWKDVGESLTKLESESATAAVVECDRKNETQENVLLTPDE